MFIKRLQCSFYYYHFHFSIIQRCQSRNIILKSDEFLNNNFFLSISFICTQELKEFSGFPYKKENTYFFELFSFIIPY